MITPHRGPGRPPNSQKQAQQSARPADQHYGNAQLRHLSPNFMAHPQQQQPPMVQQKQQISPIQGGNASQIVPMPMAYPTLTNNIPNQQMGMPPSSGLLMQRPQQNPAFGSPPTLQMVFLN